MDERLISRLSGGLIVDIGAPDFETKVAILRGKAEERKVSFAPGVIEELARLDFTSVRELQGAMNRLIAQQSLDGTLTPAQVRAVLGVDGMVAAPEPAPAPEPSRPEPVRRAGGGRVLQLRDEHRHHRRGADRAVEGARRRDGRVLDGRGISHRRARAADGRAGGAAELRGGAARLRSRRGAAPSARGEGLDGGSDARRQRGVSRSRAAGRGRGVRREGAHGRRAAAGSAAGVRASQPSRRARRTRWPCAPRTP